MGRLRIISIHLSIWITFVIAAILTYGYGSQNWKETIYETSISHIISAVVFYVTALFALPKLLDKKRYFLFALVLFSVLVTSILFRFWFGLYIYPYLFDRVSSIATKDVTGVSIKFAFQWYIFSLYSVGLWQFEKRINSQKKLAEREKLELENAALRAQINPHFILNTLNLFRSQTADLLPTVSEGIGGFMQIIRAGISSPGVDGKIPLEIELDAIEGTIFTFRQRFPNLCLSHITSIKDEDKIRILPHILVPFVENAFKHGEYDDKDKKMRIEITVDEKGLKLFVYNKKSGRIKDQSNGIGLRYVKRHLEAGYYNRHKLIISETVEDFTVDLSIQLN